MTIEIWSDNIFKAELQDDPGFADDLSTLTEQVEANPDANVVLSFSGVNHLNSSNLARLLKLRKLLVTNKRRLILCSIDTNVWGLFLVTGLDKVFEFADNVATALTSMQLDASFSGRSKPAKPRSSSSARAEKS